MLQEVKYWLCKCFSMKDIGDSTYILRIKITRDRSKRLIAFSQSAFLEKTLNIFRIENSKNGYTLMIEKPNYRKSQEAKYIVAAKASMEAVLMRKFIDGLGDVVPSNKRPMEKLCYIEPAIAIVNDLGILKRARHFQRKYHNIREVI
nr:putative retrotransposon protein [Tanacetum cinerariifolium]